MRKQAKPYATSYEIAKRIGVPNATYERSKKIIQKELKQQKKPQK